MNDLMRIGNWQVKEAFFLQYVDCNSHNHRKTTFTYMLKELIMYDARRGSCQNICKKNLKLTLVYIDRCDEPQPHYFGMKRYILMMEKLQKGRLPIMQYVNLEKIMNHLSRCKLGIALRSAAEKISQNSQQWQFLFTKNIFLKNEENEIGKSAQNIK
eukprot:403345116